MLKGIDAAFYEPLIDWEKVQNAGYEFAFIKCSQSTYNDKKFYTHWINAKVDGMPRGAYHFYDTQFQSATPQKQAEFFFSSLGNDLGELPFALDLELYTTGYWFGSRYWYDYIERLNELSGNHPLIIYTAPSYWSVNATKTPSAQDQSYFAKYPLWIANYKVSVPGIPKPWKDWLFWQYDSQLVDGVTDELNRPTGCDVDYFHGDREAFNKLIGVQTPPSNGGTMTQIIKGEVLQNLKIHLGVQGAEVGQYLYVGDKIEADKQDATLTQWLHLTRITRKDGSNFPVGANWWVSAGTAQQYIKWVWETVPVDTPTIVKTHTIDIYNNGMISIDGTTPY